jgi:hypothetical protein
MSKIHHTAGYYSNGDAKINGVKSENLDEHIEYNLNWRPGRAFFVDGKCLNQGNLSKERCNEIEKELQAATMNKDTAPYH